MIITDSQVALSSSRQASSYSQMRESLTIWQRDREPAVIESNTRDSQNGVQRGLGNSSDSRVSNSGLQLFSQQIQAQQTQFQFIALRSDERVDISTRAKQLQNSRLSAVEEEEQLEETDGEYSLKITLISMLYEKLTGRKLELFDASELEKKQKKIHENSDELHRLHSGGNAINHGGRGRQDGQSVGWGMRYERHETHYESEKVNFSAQALVKTADGKQIDVNLELNMAREFLSEDSISILAGDALKDPLVINYAGGSAELTEQKYSFDIDIDGQVDQMSFVKYGSGFLAYDKNGNKQIDDGSELFGARTGDGFVELAEYDGDNNGWIDENDAIYSQLKVWSKLPDGADQLLAVAELDVGAIYLGRAATEFSLNDAENQQQGQVRSTGIYLTESGGAGTIQQIDLVA